MNLPVTQAADVDLFAPDAVADPFPLYARLRETAPVYAVPGTTFHLVSTWDLVEEAAQRTTDFSSHLRGILRQGDDGLPERFPMDLDGAVEQVLATADGSAHKAHRRFVLQALARRIRLLEEAADEIVDDLWQSHAANGRVDWADAVANRLPPMILARLLGMPDEDLPRLLTAAYESVELLGGIVPAERMEYLVEATFALHGYLETTLQATDPAAEGLFGVLAGALASGDIELGTATMILMQLVGAGAETTAGLIGTAGRLLALHPDLQHELRSDPALIDPFLDECLRLDPPLRGHYRVATRDTVLGGVPIPTDSHLLLLWSSANRDPARYASPDSIDLTRPGVRQHLAFGKGVHFCVGSPLARLEATAAIRALLANTASFTLDPAAAPTWVPSIVVRRTVSLPLTFTTA
jgi:cytochrome P450